MAGKNNTSYSKDSATNYKYPSNPEKVSYSENAHTGLPLTPASSCNITIHL